MVTVAAGAAGLIKTALSLHHRVLPPTLNVKQPSDSLEIEESHFYINTETRPWFRRGSDQTRKAAVSAFGFGGTNFHVVLEEYNKQEGNFQRTHSVSRSILISADAPADLLERVTNAQEELESDDPAAGQAFYTR